VQPGAVFKVVLKKRRRRGIWRIRRSRLVEKVVAGKKSVGNELNIATRRDVFKPLEWRELLRQPGNALCHVRPLVVFAFPQDRTVQRDTPGLLGTVRKAQTLERYREENDVAILRHAAGAAPQGVEAVIVALTFGVDGIGLHAERIRKEIICAVKIAECIEQNANGIVLIGTFALRKVRANFSRFVLANKGHVKIPVVIGKVG